MIFPIGDDNIIGGKKPLVSYSLLVINIIVFLYTLSLGDSAELFLNSYGSIPFEISSGQDLFTLFTSMFLHAGLFHIIGNMLFLWIFADNIEAVIGSKLFLLFYLGGGLVASMVHILSDWDSVIPTVGASGAISAVMGTYLVMFPKSRIKVIFIFFAFYVPALVFLGLWFIQQLLSGIGNIAPASAEEAGGVAWWAHIGGFIFGLVMGYLFKNRYSNMYSYGPLNKV